MRERHAPYSLGHGAHSLVTMSTTTTTATALAIERLSYRYPDGTTALDEVSLRIGAGERVALVGNNGAGKSTLLLHLNGILQSPRPAVSVFGMPVERKNLREIRQKVGLVFQNPDDQLFCSSVEEDVAFGPRNLGLPPGEVRRRVETSLHGVGLADCAQRSAFHLSLGQKKRAAIATVLSMNAEILALDEPTSNLDLRGRRELLALLESFPGTLVIATHDFEWAGRLCPRMVLLEAGRIIADGPPGAVMDQFTALK